MGFTDFLLQPNEYYMRAGDDKSFWEGASIRVLRTSGSGPESAISRISEQTEVLSNTVVENCTCNKDFSLLQIADSGSDPLGRNSNAGSIPEALVFTCSCSTRWAVAESRLLSNVLHTLCQILRPIQVHYDVREAPLTLPNPPAAPMYANRL
jgi:hypothetical protein